MDKSTLDTSIRLGQLLRLLSPFTTNHKDFSEVLSRLTANVENLVYVATLTGSLASESQAALFSIEQALVTSMVQAFDVTKLLDAHLGSSTTREFRSLHAVFKNKKSVGVRSKNDSTLILGSALLALEKGPSLKGQGALLNPSAKGALVHAYTSVVNNSSWLPTLLRLKVPAAASAIKASELLSKHGSAQGQERLVALIGKTFPSVAVAVPVKTSRAKKKAIALFSTQVVFSAETLLAQPDIAALASLGSPLPASKKDMENLLSDLLVAATTPVTLKDGESADVVAQHVLDTLMKGLRARQKAIDADVEKAREKAEEAERDKAMKALKTIDPKVLALLKKNPELLKSL